MTLAQRLGRVEENFGGPSDPVTYIMVVDDHHDPVDQDELAAYVARLCPEGGYTLARLIDNGRDPAGLTSPVGAEGGSDSAR